MKMRFLNLRPRTAFGVSVLAIGLVLTHALVTAGEARPKPPPKPAKKTEKQPKKQLNGAELYAVHCNRCHPERYAPERTDAQWETILLHMRTRANLPAGQARAILNYLKDDSGK